MKTLEERAKEAWSDYEYREGELYNSCFTDGFLAGAKSEREELLRWRDPKEELPEDNICVLINSRDKSGNEAIYCGSKEDNLFITDNGFVLGLDFDTYTPQYRNLIVVGWRPIHEL